VCAASAVCLHVVGYDPFADLRCARVCRETPGPWVDVPPSTVVQVEGLLVLSTVAAGLLAVVAGRTAPALLRASTGASLVLVGAAVAAEIVWRDTDAWARTTSSWLTWALAPAACAVCVLAAGAARTRRAVDALLRDLEEGPADGVHFLVPGENRWVDAAGRDVAPDASSVVLLRDEHGPVVRLAGARNDQEVAELSASRRLALFNARSTALASARLREVQAAQRRAVQRADAERHRIERDLHDGAQQTLVGAAFHLSAAAARAGWSPEVEQARDDVAAALARLRELVHGPVPAVLVEEGIQAALEELAAEAVAPVAAAVHGTGEPPIEVAGAAYLCAEAIVGRAAPRPCSIDVEVAEQGVRLVGRSSGDLSEPLDDALLDRVGALGGVVRSTRDGAEWSMEVCLPCGS
jgi:signal transduction histidine kinase